MSNSRAVRAHVLVAGRVQGVFFRESTRRKAELLEICGWVRNLADGRVEAVIEGREPLVAELLDFIKSGPGASQVRELECVMEEFSGEFSDFNILRD